MTADNIYALKQILKLQESLHGPYSEQCATALVRLAEGYTLLGDFKTAENCYGRALHIEEGLRNEENAEKIRLALLELRKDDDEDGLKVSSARVPVFVPQTQLMPAPTPATEKTEDGTALTEMETAWTEQYLKAQPIPDKKRDPLDEAISVAQNEIFRLKQSAQNTRLADALVELADLYSRRKQLDQMEVLLLEALKVREAVLGSNHLSVSTDLKNLGRLYYVTGRYALADNAIKRALEMREAQLGPYHPQVADIAEIYAKLMRKTDREQEAQEQEARVAESRARHRSDWEAYKKAALKAMDDRNFFDAQAMWLAALEESSEFEPEDPRVITTLENLAEVYWKRGKYEKAEPLCKRILNVSERLLGKNHIDVALAANNLALVCERQGKYTEAVLLYKEALTIKEQLLGADNPDVVATREMHDSAKQLAHKQLERKLQKTNLP